MSKSELEQRHELMVRNLKKKGEAIFQDLSPHKADLWHMASCICGEAGELFDAIKKYVIYDKPLDLTNVEEELGDLEFYMAGLRLALLISREQCLEANYDKLRARYPNETFSNEDAQLRRDKI